MEKGIIATGITKSFRDTVALSSVDFTSRPGINLILGPNGAGKSTLLRCIAGLYKPDRGRVTVLGSNPYDDAQLRKRISFLADNYGLYDFLTVKENLAFFGRFFGLDREESLKKVKRLVKELDLSKYIDIKVDALSRGTKQKVAFCRTVLNDAEVYLLDEPTAFLDVRATSVIRNYLQDLASEGKTIVFVTQRIDEVTRFNSRILVIRKGKIVADTSTKGLYDSILRDAHVTIRLAKPISAQTLRSIHGLVATNSADATTITVRVMGYKQITDTLSALIKKGAYVVSVDYIEPAIDELMFGGTSGA